MEPEPEPEPEQDDNVWIPLRVRRDYFIMRNMYIGIALHVFYEHKSWVYYSINSRGDFVEQFFDC